MLPSPQFDDDQIQPQDHSNQSDETLDTMADEEEEMDIEVDNDEYSNGDVDEDEDAVGNQGDGIYEDDDEDVSPSADGERGEEYDEHDDDDDDDDFNDDEPLDVQLKNRREQAMHTEKVANGHVGRQEGYGHAENDDDEDDDDDDEDDLPLSSRIPSSSGQRRAPRRLEPEPQPNAIEWESEDDLPLAEVMRRKFGAKKAKTKRRSSGASTKASTKRRRSESGSGTRAKSASKASAKKTTTNRARKEKEEDAPSRKFEKPGQRRETPPDSDPARLFYQSLYEQKLARGKTSQMAENWMLRHGLLDDDVAEQVLSRLKAAK